MKTQTAVEWLVKELNNKIDYIPINYWDSLREIIQQALAMEKEQIIDALFFGIHLENNKIDSPLTRAEQYYSETYEK